MFSWVIEGDGNIYHFTYIIIKPLLEFNASYLIQFMVLPSKPSELTPPFASMDSPFTAARYHSLVIEEETFPHDALEATAWTEDGLIMAARHKKYKHIQVLLFPNVLCHAIGCLRWPFESCGGCSPWNPALVLLWLLTVTVFRVSNSTRRASSPLKARKSSSTSSDSLRNWRSSVHRGVRCHRWLS